MREKKNMKGIEECFNEMDAVRKKHTIKSLICEILIITRYVLALGVAIVCERGKIAKITNSWIKTQVGLALKNELPSHDIISAVLQIIN